LEQQAEISSFLKKYTAKAFQQTALTGNLAASDSTRSECDPRSENLSKPLA
jgi:hypothetical protein